MQFYFDQSIVFFLSIKQKYINIIISIPFNAHPFHEIFYYSTHCATLVAFGVVMKVFFMKCSHPRTQHACPDPAAAAFSLPVL